jgi:alpha-beta hydrolase superfamily lysophospholipase
MLARTGWFLRKALIALGWGALGVAISLLVGAILYLDGHPDLQVWHQASLDEEFTADSAVASFAEYLALEDRLFRQLDEQVYAQAPDFESDAISRYNRGSIADPEYRQPNWNRSFELCSAAPAAGVLLLHGMSDSPYSLRQLGQRLHAAGACVIGMRMPGHGTAPSGLVELRVDDMAAAVQLGMQHLAEQSGDGPLYIVGYSTGAALALQYVLTQRKDASLPSVDRLVMLSPAIGVTPLAAFAVWQARLGHLLGLDKVAWETILPEYDPYKYGSFAVNAGDVVYRLTDSIQRELKLASSKGEVLDLPPILAFASLVDATVSTSALVSGLFDRLPASGHELVLFDINRLARIEPLLQVDPGPVVRALQARPDPGFTLSLVTNRDPQSQAVKLRTRAQGQPAIAETQLDMSWPPFIYSLAHVALPFAPDDPLYGSEPPTSPGELKLGNLAMRGERGVFLIPATDMLRQRWNPFYSYVEARVLQHLKLTEPSTP